MRTITCCGAILVAALGSAQAADPIGEWVVEDGNARVRIVDCNTRLWGVLAWEKKAGGIDAENTDSTKKGRPLLGIPLLINMKKAAPSRNEAESWEGKVYNAQNGKLYDASIKLESANALEIKGCILGFLCGGQTWTRFGEAPATPGAPGAVKGVTPKATPAPPAPVAATKAKTPAPGAPVGISKALTAPSEATSAEICALPEIATAKMN